MVNQLRRFPLKHRHENTDKAIISLEVAKALLWPDRVEKSLDTCPGILNLFTYGNRSHKQNCISSVAEDLYNIAESKRGYPFVWRNVNARNAGGLFTVVISPSLASTRLMPTVKSWMMITNQKMNQHQQPQKKKTVATRVLGLISKTGA